MLEDEVTGNGPFGAEAGTTGILTEFSMGGVDFRDVGLVSVIFLVENSHEKMSFHFFEEGLYRIIK